MKKIISLVLSLVMVLSMAVTASAASFPDVADHVNEVAIDTLTDLGVINGYPDGTYGPEKHLTRAEMVALVIRALGYGDMVQGLTTTKFSDVPANYWASGYIAFANGLGIIDGYGNGKFGPNDEVTYDQIIAMVIRALGYREAALPGTYPTAGIYKALSLKILDGIKTGNEPATRGQIAQLVYNALSTEIVETHYNSLFDVYSVTTNTDDTMLKRLGAKVTEGLLNYNDAVKLGMLAKTGQYAEIYTNSKGEAISASILETVLVGTATKDNDIKVGNTTYRFGKGCGLDKATYLTNGKIVNGDDFKVGQDKTYIISCETNGTVMTHIYSIAEWLPTQTFQVTKSDINALAKNKIGGYIFGTDKNEKIDTKAFILNGAKSLDDIVIGDIITVYTYGNSGNTIVRIDVASNIISGTVDKIKTTNGEKIYTIKGTTYKLAAGVSELAIGVEYKCYLDADGKIFKADRIASSAQKFAIYNGFKAGDVFDDTRVSLFTPGDVDGEIFTITDDDILPVDGFDGLIKYTTNKNGKIDTMTVADNAELARVTGSIVKADGSYYRLAADAVVFTYTTTDVAIGSHWVYPGTIYAHKVTDYKTVRVFEDISTVAKIEKSVDITNVDYILDTDDTVVALYVPAVQADASTGTGYAVINEVSTIATASGSAQAITGYIDGKAVEDYPTVGNNVVGAPAIGLYKVSYSGSDIKTATLVDTNMFASENEVEDIDDNFIKVDNQWIVLDDDVIIYEYDADEKTYEKVNYINGGYIFCYDTTKTPDSVYDVVIWSESKLVQN